MPGTQRRRRIAEEKIGSMFFLVCSLSFLDYWNFIFLVVFHCFHFGAKRDRCSQTFHTARCIFDMIFSFLFSFFLWLHFRGNDFWSFDIPLVPVPFVFFLALPKLRLWLSNIIEYLWQDWKVRSIQRKHQSWNSCYGAIKHGLRTSRKRHEFKRLRSPPLRLWLDGTRASLAILFSILSSISAEAFTNTVPIYILPHASQLRPNRW